MAIHDKTTTNKWTYERSYKSLNSYSLVEYNKIYHNTNSWKTLQEESLWQVDFDSLYFWNTLNNTHQGIFVWNRNNRLHTNNKKHVYKERKETTHERVDERKNHTPTIWKRKEVQCMSINGYKTSCTRTMYLRKKSKEKIHNILTTSCWHLILQPAFNLTWRVKG